MQKDKTKIILDKNNCVCLKSPDLLVEHVCSEKDLQELLQYYNGVNLTPQFMKYKGGSEFIMRSPYYYVVKDQDENICGDVFMAPINKDRTIAEVMGLFEPMPNEESYQKLHEFLCYAAKHYSYKRLVISVPTYEEYRRLLEIGFEDIQPEYADKIQTSTSIKNGFKNILNHFFSVQINVSKMPETELEKTAVISKF